jgi:hypothetical protein
MSSKQPKTTTPTGADLKGNPMIGGAKGTTASGTTPDDLQDALDDTTIEGDTMNGGNDAGGIDKTPGADPRK